MVGDTYYDEAARTATVAKAERWTGRQAWRLNTAPEVILEAVRERAWLPAQIEEVTSKYQLEDDPPELVGVEPWFDAAIDRKAILRPNRLRRAVLL